MLQRLSRSTKRSASPSAAQTLRRASSSVVEALERRQMLSCTYDAAARTVTVTGTNDPNNYYADTIFVDLSQITGKLTVTTNGEFDDDFFPTDVDHFVIDAGAGDDTITIDRSVSADISSTLIGGSGNDEIYDGFGNDNVWGVDGNDTIYAGWGSDTIHGGAGQDTIDYNVRSGGVRILLGGSATSGDIATNENDLIYADVECAQGSQGADYIRGTTGANTLKGGAGNDMIQGDLGVDYIEGGDGDDLIYGGLSTYGYDAYGNPLPDTDTDDTIYGEAGNDTIYGNSGNDSIFAGEGDDLVYGGYGTNEIYCDKGNDTAYGGYGNDYLDGGEGNDNLYGDSMGGNGNDVLNGGVGSDLMSGGGGDDKLILIRDSSVDMAYGGGGWDVVEGAYDNGSPCYDVFSDIDAFL